MIPPHKLARLPRHQLLRKAFRILDALARGEGDYPLPDLFGLVARAGGGALTARFAEHLAEYSRALRDVAPGPGGDAPGADDAPGPRGAARAGDGGVLRGLILRARDDLRGELGIDFADWDLPAEGAEGGAIGRVLPGVAVYLDDVRSPFNVGSVFRTAESFGVERLYLSPWTADPEHPRSRRTARGCVGRLPWERATYEGLVERLGDGAGEGTDGAGKTPGGAEGIREGFCFFALELGGTPIADFEFPARGVAIVGSEELGVSPSILSDPRVRRVSIPLAGRKASLNLSVAFGIMMERWSEGLGGLPS